jgi:hypothetical protein
LLSSWRLYGDNVRGFIGVAVAGEGLPSHRWFLGVTSHDAGRYVVVVLVEHAVEPQAAAEIGTALFGATQTIR